MSVSLRVVLVLLSLSLLALIVTGSPIYFRLSYLWGFLLAGSLAWTVLALRGITLRRQTRTLRAQVGQIFQERFEVQNHSLLPRLWLEVRDRSSLPGSRGSYVLPLLWGRQQWPYRARTPLLRRGVFPLGPTVLTSRDPFGLFPVSRTVPAESSLLVYPMTVEVPSFPGPPGLLPGGDALRRRTHQITPNAAGVREYVPGDSLNRIHWMSTARRGYLMSKEFELDPLAEVWLLLDADRSVHVALSHSLPSVSDDGSWRSLTKALTQVELPPSTEEYAVSIAASLGQYFLRRGRAVGLASCGQAQSPDVLPPDRGGRQLTKILEALALLCAEGDLPISALAAAQARHLPRGSTVVLITPSIQEEVALTVDVLMRRGLRPVAVLLDAVSFGGPSGTAELVAAITALNVPVCQVKNGADLGTALSIVGAR